jgi:PAS domain S-box-containing protein
MRPKDDLRSAAPGKSRAALRVVVLYGVSAGLVAALGNVALVASVTDRTALVYLDIAKDGILMVVGAVLLYVVVLRGTAERNQLEERYRSIIAVMEEGIVVQDAHGVIQTCNAAAERLLGVTSDQLMGRTSLDARWQAIHEDGSPFLGEAHPAMVTLRTGKPLSNVVMGVRRPDGTPKWISINSQPMVGGGEGAPYAVVTSFSDITERVQAYQTLEQRVQERTREIERRRQVVEGLRDIVAILNSNRSLDEILEFVAGQATRLLQARAVAIYLVQPDGRLRMQTADGEGTHLPADVSFAVGEGPLGQAVLQRQPVSICDIGSMVAGGHERRADARLGPYWEQVAVHHGALLAIPLSVEEQTLGGMMLYYPHESQLNSEETQLAVALGDQAALAIQNARLRQQAEQLAVLDERHRLARELHDSVTQSLFSLTLLAEAGRRLAGMGDLARVQTQVARLGATAQQALKEMRLLVYQLRPLELEREGLVGALQQRLDAVERRAGVEARLLVEGAMQLPPAVEEELYRIAREALNNALKHAMATSVVVRIRVENGQLELDITDNGTGFDLNAAGDRGGLGLVGMRERAERLGGMLTIQSTPGHGSQVHVRISVDSEVPV